MKIFGKVQLSILGAATLAACVDHRPVRNGLLDESVYLDKTNLTKANPKLGEGATDDGWLFKVTVVKASAPNVVGDYAFPGLESDTQYIKFRFMENALQMVDGRRLQNDDPNNPNDDLATTTDRVMLEFTGGHVDVKLRESLDGERTNFLEENFEEPWMRRQKFKVDWERTSLDPVVNFGWFYGDYLADCARMQSAHMVPGSFEWDENDQYLSFVLEVNYTLKAITFFGGCWDLVSLANGVGTATIQYRFSFYRPGPSNFQVWQLDEKAPENKQYGVFQRLQTFIDPETGLMDAKSLVQRFNPDRTDPVVFYFHEGFPQRFLPMFDEIKAETNQILADSGAKLRIDFKNFDDGGVVRHFGDLRYSFVVWHQDIETTRGLLGYGPSASDPRTGETISANLNLYNIGMDWYRFLIQDYLETNGASGKPDDTKPWEEIACNEGDTITNGDKSVRLRSTLFQEMRRVMNVPEPGPTDDATDAFLPEPQRGRDAFLEQYHRTLGEYRYAEPLWNQYVYQPSAKLPIADFGGMLAKEREFQSSMTSILNNQDPFQGVSLYSKGGIDAQQKLAEDFRVWRKNHDQLEFAKEMMLARKNIYVFEPNDAISAITGAARRCVGGKWESDEQYQERIIEAVVHHVAVHEFGHNLGLRHNFYGSVDAKHMEEGEVSASVMDYVYSPEEAATPKGWGGYDQAALKWIYGTSDVKTAMLQQDFLYCTDEHRFRSPLCAAHDLGITPSQIVLNAIERYDWLYEIRNKRAFRTFWDTSTYVNSVYGSIYPLLRMWYLAIFDWGGGGVQDTLKKLDQVSGGEVLTDPEYTEIAMDFYNDIQAAVGMTMAFYDAVINQPSSFRDYQTKYDPFYGDILQLGIIIDKLFTTFAFMDLQEVYDYNPDVYTYVSLYDAPFGDPNTALSQRVLDDMLGSNYDTFPWFRYYAIGLFASVTNSDLVSKIELKERIAISRYENEAELVEAIGQEGFDQAVAAGNISQTFVKDGEEFVYTFMADRAWHLVAGRSRSPVSFQFLKEYNDTLNGEANPDEDNYGLKILLAYYEYYNNFVGF